jgi:hypothetical protein
MPETLSAAYVPTEYGTKPSFQVGDRTYSVGSSFALARRLLATGYQPDDTLAVTDRHGRPMMKPKALDQLAAWDIHEGTGGIVLRRHRPERVEAFTAMVRQKRAGSLGAVP